jgi:hypothetical protein
LPPPNTTTFAHDFPAGFVHVPFTVNVATVTVGTVVDATADNVNGEAEVPFPVRVMSTDPVSSTLKFIAPDEMTNGSEELPVPLMVTPSPA